MHCVDKATFWFYAMEKQMRAQRSWQAIEFYHEIAEEAFEFIKNEVIDWLKVDLKGDVTIETGQSPTTAMEAKAHHNNR